MIQVESISYRYPNERVPALIDVSAQVEPGEVVGVVGPNGSGKSTLGRQMKGLIVPSEGHVLVDGLDTRNDGLEARRLVGLVFQNPTSQIVNAVVEQEVAFGLENLGLSPAEIRVRVDDAMNTVGLAGMNLAECQSLSMANKQRVALASVIAMEPRYLVLDEATAWLEPQSRWSLLDTIVAWSRSHGAGLVLITHRMDEAQICRRVYGMLDGRVELVGTLDELLRDDAEKRRLALEVPDTAALATELESAGLPVVPGTPVTQLAAALCHS